MRLQMLFRQMPLSLLFFFRNIKFSSRESQEGRVVPLDEPYIFILKPSFFFVIIKKEKLISAFFLVCNILCVSSEFFGILLEKAERLYDLV